MKRQPLAYVGLFFIVIGVAVFLLTAFGIQALKAHDEWYVPHFFGPQHAPEYGYDQLYDYTVNLTRLRGLAELRFFYTLASSCVILGGVLFGWARDRKRLRDFTKPSPNKSLQATAAGPTSSD
jgi:hypothetical protein